MIRKLVYREVGGAQVRWRCDSCGRLGLGLSCDALDGLTLGARTLYIVNEVMRWQSLSVGIIVGSGSLSARAKSANDRSP